MYSKVLKGKLVPHSLFSDKKGMDFLHADIFDDQAFPNFGENHFF